MGQKLLNETPRLDLLPLTFGFAEDFFEFVTGDLWTSLAADATSSVAAGDAAGGTIVLTSGATDNNEAYVYNTKEMFKFAVDKPIKFAARLQYAEANTDDANVATGLMDAVGANSILDDGGGPKASYSGAVIFKVDGSTVWQCETSNGATQTTTASSVTAGGSGYHSFEIHVVKKSSTEAEVTFWCDENGGNAPSPMKDSSGNVIRHTVLFASATEMKAFAGVKAGGANSEVVTVDYIGCEQKR